MDDSTISLPATALRKRDYCCDESGPMDQGKHTAPKYIEPQAGDPVDFSVRGSVVSVENGIATVRIAFVNDKRVQVQETEQGERATEGDRLRESAMQADEEGDY